MTPIGEQAKGKWMSILPLLGVDKRYLVNRHGPCPLCDGSDRFRFDDKGGRGTWFCNQCGAGDGIELVKRINGLEFKEAAREITKHLGTAPVHEIRRGPSREEVQADIQAIWRQAKPLADVLATALWWTNRTGQLPLCRDIRAREALELKGVGRFPAMVALVRGPDDKVVNMHRTFLTDKGEKAEIDDPRRVMALGLPKGCAVRLADPAPAMGIAEGIETAMAASILHEVPVWAALNAGNLEGWTPPEGVRKVVIFGDNDRSATGQAASWLLAKRLRLKGFAADVCLPPHEGDDWNDVLLRQRHSLDQAA